MMDEKNRQSRSLEDIIEEVQSEHMAQGAGNQALEAMLRKREAANAVSPVPAQEETPFPPQSAAPRIYPAAQTYAPVPPAFSPSVPDAAPVPAEPDAPAYYEPPSDDEEFDMPPKKKKKKKKRGSAGKKVAGVLVGAVILLAGAAFGYTYAFPGIHFGVQAGAISVGGMSLADAKAAIDGRAEALLHGQTVTLKIYDTEYDVAIDAVATGLDSESSAEAAYAYTHTGDPLTRVGHALGALFGGHEVPLSVSLDDRALNERLDEIAAVALTEPIDPTWMLEGDELVIDAGRPGVTFNRRKIAEQASERIRTMDFKAFEVEIETSAPKAIDVETICTEVQADAKNATVDKSDGKTIIPSVDGVKVDPEKARAIVGDGTEQIYRIPVERTPAEVTADKLAEVLFRDTLASTSTSLNSGNRPRTNNVRLACEHINGTILNPGEEFSYNNTVGQRTAERGFQSAGAYLNGQVVDEVGGGVCQPSSTLYMAVLRADLEVTERHNHSFTVAYTPLGEDATVSWGGPDFRFKNDTPYPVKIIASQSGGSCNMKLVGTKTSDKKVSLETKILSTLNFETVEKADASLSPGTRKTSQTGTTGYKTVTYKTVTENGQSTTTTANNSYYKKRDKIILVGPAAPEEPTTPTTPTAPATPAEPTTPEQPAAPSQPASGDPEG